MMTVSQKLVSQIMIVSFRWYRPSR